MTAIEALNVETLAQVIPHRNTQSINDIYQITNQLSELTKELLLLSELDNAQHLTFSDQIQLDQLINRIVRHEHYAIDQKSLMLMSDLESTYFLGNERLLHQAISNLIINAIKYSNKLLKKHRHCLKLHDVLVHERISAGCSVKQKDVVPANL